MAPRAELRTVTIGVVIVVAVAVIIGCQIVSAQASSSIRTMAQADAEGLVRWQVSLLEDRHPWSLVDAVARVDEAGVDVLVVEADGVQRTAHGLRTQGLPAGMRLSTAANGEQLTAERGGSTLFVGTMHDPTGSELYFAFDRDDTHDAVKDLRLRGLLVGCLAAVAAGGVAAGLIRLRQRADEAVAAGTTQRALPDR